ncbi:porin [Paraburkholderia graminis]|uniref:porin n=1 Tax=Paraburkholderia graminis TaxID=60548 RepID=UPI0038B8CA78
MAGTAARSESAWSGGDANLRYLLAPATTLIDIYTFTDGRANNMPGTGGASLDPKWHQFTLGVDYALSKRTDVYVSATYQLVAADASTHVVRRIAVSRRSRMRAARRRRSVRWMCSRAFARSSGRALA